MENTFDSTYIIRKEKYNEFVADAEKLAIAVVQSRGFYKQNLGFLMELYKQDKHVNPDKERAVGKEGEEYLY